MKQAISRLTKLSSFFYLNLRCPICKSKLLEQTGALRCEFCNSLYQQEKGIYDFRGGFDNPLFDTVIMKKWRRIQERVEKIYGTLSYDFEGEIDGVKEIYTEEFKLGGVILDIGGHQGRLRHFLEDRSGYISIDPFMDVFDKIVETEGLVDAYPCLLEPCNFVAGYGEHLPFQSEMFDWVHLRSVLDHFYSPFSVIKESIRVLKKGGKILIGSAVIGGDSVIPDDGIKILASIKRRFQIQGFRGLLEAIYGRLKVRFAGIEEGHMKEWSYKELVTFIGESGLEIEKVHWQKPPENYCVYISCLKI